MVAQEQNHPDFESYEYTKHKDQLKTVDDVYCGTDTAVSHIVQFPREDNKDYENRKKRSSLDNYVAKTVNTTVDIIFRKPIDTEGIKNNNVKTWLEKADYKRNINEFAKETLKNRVKDGYTYILIDSPEYNPNEIISKTMQEQNNIRPFFTNIKRVNVPNYVMDRYGNYTQFSIRETYTEKKGAYGWEVKKQIRLYELVNNQVQISLWRDKEEVEGSRKTLVAKQIPIVKIGEDDIPPLYDQAKLNLQHLNTDSEKSSYIRVGLVPFLQINGEIKADDDSGTMTLGINQPLQFTDENGGAKWIEMSGKNYDIANQELKFRADQMEKMSVEFVTELKNATATEVEKASTSNESKLTDFSQELEEGINTAIEMMGWFTTDSLGENKISTNKDFDSNILTIQQATFLQQLRASGDISYDMFLDLLIKGELLPYLDEKQRETEKMRVRDEFG